jgi:hypothetical protein
MPLQWEEIPSEEPEYPAAFHWGAQATVSSGETWTIPPFGNNGTGLAKMVRAKIRVFMEDQNPVRLRFMSGHASVRYFTPAIPTVPKRGQTPCFNGRAGQSGKQATADFPSTAPFRHYRPVAGLGSFGRMGSDRLATSILYRSSDRFAAYS